VEEVGHEVRELNFAVKAVQQMQIQSSQGKR
jgi:hypothetical protein